MMLQIPDALRLLMAFLAFGVVFVFVVVSSRAQNRAAAELAAFLRARGWMNVRSKFLSGRFREFRAQIDAREATVHYGIPDKRHPMTLRVSFPTDAEESFEIRLNTSGSDANIFLRPLFTEPAKPFLGGTLQIRGRMSDGLTSRLMSDRILRSLREALTAPEDFISVRRGKVVVNRGIIYEPKPGQRMLFRLRPPREQLERNAGIVDAAARSLISAGL